MRLQLFRSAWGLAGLNKGDRRRVFANLRTAGWHGVEASLEDIGGSVVERQECVAAAKAEDMSLILSAYSSWTNYEGPFDATSTVQEHSRAFASELSQIAKLAASAPGVVIRVNAHSGSDAWTEGEAHEYFEAALRDAKALGDALPAVSHETHRGRYLCCPFVTARMLRLLPALRLTSDFSHWVVKCERLLDTPAEHALLTSQIAPAVDHIHARIGTPQAPQVADVEHKTVRPAAERHYEWWESVWAARGSASLSGRDALLSATIEYGPIEVGDGGELATGSYTPATLGLEPVAGVGHEATLDVARRALDGRFEKWHEEAAAQQGGLKRKSCSE